MLGAVKDMQEFELRHGAMYSRKECEDDHWGIKRDIWRDALKWALDQAGYEREEITQAIEKELGVGDV